MIVTILLTTLLIGSSGTESEPEESVPVTRTFRSTNLINMRSVDQLFSETFEFRVGHRFGDVYTGLYDAFGLDLGASVYFGLDFGLTDDLMVGFSRLNQGKIWDFHAQYRIITQKTSGGSPVSLSVFSQWDQVTQKGIQTSYFMISPLVARKWTKTFSTQISPFYIQRLENKDNLIGAQRVFGTGLSAHYLITKTVGFLVEWSPVFNRDEYNGNSATRLPWDVISAGINFEVAGHSFQIVASNSQQISTVNSMLGSSVDWTEKHFYLGFNLTRLYSLTNPY